MSAPAGVEVPRPPGGYRLPPDAYLSDHWLAREQEAVFEATWSLVAAIDDLPRPGDVIDVTVGRYPILLAHTDDGLRAHHNMCRHRGMALVCGPARTGDRVRCPYHGWEFSTDDGSLARIPQRATQFGDVDDDALGLLPASVAVWEGLVFVHPHAAAPSFDDFLAGVADGIGSFRPGELRQVGRVDITGRCNWKLFVENHVDVYHLWYLHEGTLADFDHTRFEHATVGGNWVSYEPARAGARPPAGTGGIAHLDQRDRDGIGAHLLFPNTTMAATADYFATYAAFPVSPTETRIELRIRAEDAERGDALVAAARSFIDEDVLACEQIQEVIGSPSFGVGPLARTHEAPILAFQDHLLDRLGLDGAEVGLPAARPGPRQ